MGWVESLQRAIDYMEEHIEEPVTMSKLPNKRMLLCFISSGPFRF